MNRMRRLASKENPLLIALILLFLSILLGGVFAKIIQVLKTDGLDSINSRYFTTIIEMKIDYSDLFRYIYFGLMKKFLFVWMLSLTILGLPCLCLMIITNGFSFGFLLLVLLYRYGAKGLLLMLVYQFPHGLIYLPVAFLTLKYCFQFTMECNHGEYPPSLRNITMLKKYGKIILLLIVALTVGAVFETFLGSFLLRKVLLLF